MIHEDVANFHRLRASHNEVIFLLEGLIAHLNVGTSQTNFQQFHNVFYLQDEPFHQYAIVMNFISDYL
jgi:hypothetical protein